MWITSEINALKLEYHTVVSRDDNSYRQDLLTDFISNCLRLYKLSLDFDFQLPISDRRPGDDAGMLAAMGLVRLYRTRARNVHHSNALLRSVIVLEHVLLHSKHNYDALLILVRLYMFLGAGSLAIERYSRLSIKNIQHATISWVLYTRISTIHPHPATFPAAKADSYSRIDPLVDMQEAIKWHQNAQNLSEKSVCTMQENGQWNMSLDALATQKHIWSSFPKYLLIAETKRIQRHRSSTHDLPDQLQSEYPNKALILVR